MAVAGSETGLLDYTKEWIERINRGGLFPINDEMMMKHFSSSVYLKPV